jgi:hypothetical protein
MRIFRAEMPSKMTFCGAKQRKCGAKRAQIAIFAPENDVSR